MQTIKITQTNKGQFHWEDFLLRKQEIRTLKLLNHLEAKPQIKNKVIKLLKRNVNRENIIPLYKHPINIFLNALIHNKLDELQKQSTLINN